MHLSRYLFVLFCIGLFLSSCYRTPVEVFPIIENWQFKNSDSGTWMSAGIPGSVHLDLLQNSIIDDPFFGSNELDLQWIGETNWDYKTKFHGDFLLESDHVDLVFNGLDTYADVYFNDSLILSTDNMFRTWEIEIRNYLRSGENTIFVHFNAPEEIEKSKASELEYSLPDTRGFTRKSPYQYGWDWGPRFITMGIWKPVFVRAWDDIRIKDVALSMNGLSDSMAYYHADVDILSGRNQSAVLQVMVNKEASTIVKKDFKLQEGFNTLSMEFKIEDPKLWWPAGLGDQPLYTFDFVLKTDASMDEWSLRTGVREVKLVQEKDSIGETFFFQVNGQAVFMKGANYIPQDNFPTRVDEKKYENTIQAALDANMNMLRVWGGGIYERDIFYDLCDEKGILVWQDFMFACNMYPGDPSFIDNVTREAEEQIRRLDHHPSVVLWCGNNEVDEGWHNWGWQSSLEYSEADSTEIWGNYKKVFHEILPDAVESFSSGRPYISSSPRIGWGHEEALLEGDMHYWGVWWGEEPFEVYEEKVGRFMSEFGFQGFPDLRTLETVLDPGDFNLASDALASHQKHPRGMELIQTYMEREFLVPVEFNHYAYVSQLVQAYGMKTALEAHRRAKPRCMGTLYWQLNDCWPVISWASLDYFNRWKALHYFARDIYKDYLVSFTRKNDHVAVYVVSDKITQSTAELEIVLMDFYGNIVFEETKQLIIPPNSSLIYFEREFNGFNRSEHLLHATLRDEEGILADNVLYFQLVKHMEFPNAEITKEITWAENSMTIRLGSEQLAKNVFLTSEADGFFSDNYFDLLPNETIKVNFYPASEDIDLRNSKIHILQLSDTFPE